MLKASRLNSIKYSALVFGACLLISAAGDPWQSVDLKTATKEIYAINQKVQSAHSFSYNVVYTTYKNHYTNDVYEQNTGYYVKNGKSYRCYAMNKLFIQNDKVQLTVDSAHHVIKVNNPTGVSDPELKMNLLESSLHSFKSVKVKNDSEIRAFRFETGMSKGIVSEEFYFDKNYVRKMVIFYANKHSLRRNDEITTEDVYPRLSIDFKDYKKLESVSSNYFSTDSIITLKKGKILLNKKYLGYKLIDGRYYK